MRKNRVWIAVVVCFVLSFANLLFAENTASSTGNTDAIVDVLKTLQQKGVITQSEYDALKAKVDSDAQKAAEQAPQLQNVAMPEGGEGEAMNVVSAMDNAVGFHTGRFDVTFSGEVNGFWVHDRAETNPSKISPCSTGGLLCLDATSALPTASVRSGLLPSDLNIKISTQEHGWDVAVYFGIWPAIQNNVLNGQVESVVGGGSGGAAGLPGYLGGTSALGTPGIDFRQNFATLGHAHFGTLKIGRDLGLFGQEAILNDMTLLGAGTPADQTGANQFPGNVTLGRIGVGYVYTDFIPQVTYTTPSYKGFQGAFSVMQAYDDTLSELLDQAAGLGYVLNGHGQPQFQGKLTYTYSGKGPVKFKVWSNFVTEKEEAPLGSTLANNGIVQGNGVRATGVDYGFNAGWHGLSLVGYAYNGWGLGLGGLFLDGIGSSSTGAPTTRASQGWYAQLGYGWHKNFFGLSYGQSNLSPSGTSDFAYLSDLFVRNNTSYVAQYRYAVTKWDNLVGEYTHTTAESQARVKGDDDSIALGTIVFF